MIDMAAAATDAFATPLDLFHRDEVALAQIAHRAADRDDAPGEFVAQDVRRLHVTRVKHITRRRVGFVHMHIGAAYAHRRHLHDDFVGPRLWVGRFAKRDARVQPNHVAAPDAMLISLTLAERIAIPRREISR